MEDYLEVDGLPLTWNLHDYLIPTSRDVPDIKTIVIESESGKGPFGAKGIGEPAMTPTPAALMNALSRATGVRMTELPLTAERVLRALRARG
jgi:CO/xanthine dehydrogenase Mo-binding subunit